MNKYKLFTLVIVGIFIISLTYATVISNNGISTQGANFSNRVNIVQSLIGENYVAVNIASKNPNESSVWISGNESSRGTLKVSHNAPVIYSDASSSALSLALLGATTAAQGIFLHIGNSTGDAITVTNGTTSLLVLDSAGQMTLSTDDSEGFLVQTSGGTDAFKVAPASGVIFTKKTIPIATNTYDLGDSTHYWKNFSVQNIIQNGTTTNSQLTGSGNAFACLDSTGKLYRSATACA
jgi:hypothetical protein